MSKRVCLAARWIFPVSSPPIENGLLEITDGRIEAVAARRGPLPNGAIDLGNTAIIPGLINAHAHLEFSSLSEPLQPPQPFTQWIRQVLTHRRERTTPLPALIRGGLRESVRGGVTVIGDIVTGDWTPTCVTEARLDDNDETAVINPGSACSPRVIAFRELIGLLSEQSETQLDIARRHIRDCRAAVMMSAIKTNQHEAPASDSVSSGNDHSLTLLAVDQSATRRDICIRNLVHPGLSPHAPYSVGPDLFHGTVELAQREQVPLAMHLAETKAELQLLRDGTGEFAEMLTAFGLWREGLIPRGTRIMDYLRPLSEAPRSLVVHGNYLADDEIVFVAQHETLSVAYCPRTHHFFGHDPHPWRRLLEAGANVCLGTDGRSSNPDYSLWREVRFLDRLTNGSMRPTLLKLATQNGAKALGLTDWDMLAVSKAADFTLIQLPERDDSDAWNLLFDGEPIPPAPFPVAPE